jgi:N-acetylglutamate synthase-like GNAT family acetyltransferase
MGERGVADVVVRPAEPADAGAVAALLRASGLPVDGVEGALDHGLVASRDGRLVGCVALEVFDESALLRSLAIVPELRGQGLGGVLTRGALNLARALGAREVYLLTDTAGEFFPRFGFGTEDRSNAPAAIKDSVEFRSACPTSALMMHARIAP